MSVMTLKFDHGKQIIFNSCKSLELVKKKLKNIGLVFFFIPWWRHSKDLLLKLDFYNNKSCQKTMTLAGQQLSLNSSQSLSFSQVGQTSRSRSRGQKLWYHVKGLVIRYTHVQYESPISSGLKVMAKVKGFPK